MTFCKKNLRNPILLCLKVTMRIASIILLSVIIPLSSVAGELDLSKRTLPSLPIKEAIDKSEAFIVKYKIQLGGKFLARVQYHETGPWTKANPATKTAGPYWQFTYEPDIRAAGGQVFILVYMDGTMRQGKGL